MLRILKHSIMLSAFPSCCGDSYSVGGESGSRKDRPRQLPAAHSTRLFGAQKRLELHSTFDVTGGPATLRPVLLAQFSAFPFSGTDLYEELKTSTAILSTGIGSLDNCLMLVGLYTGEVTGIVGGPPR
ncbi:hypothetical protein E2I00_005258 [Balaenoptera physalus]|uniref:Uncharacterized protein n=1 Tax=Balaenoptera physalus TaxID=9770 RepID=A0A643BLB6_BALPH|nr:hypothetical protein E2I00_005258 [Balaenoptera physalus]